MILDEPSETQMLFILSNRGLKKLKEGLVQEKRYLKNNKQHRIAVLHRDIYDEKYKPIIEMKKRHIKEKQLQDKNKIE